MELEKVVVVKSDEEKEPFFPSLQMFAAKKYSNYYNKFPENPVERNIPEVCLKYIKVYLPITKELVDKQYKMAKKIGDQKRLIECLEYKTLFQSITEENVFEQYGLSLKFNEQDRKNECYQFIGKHFKGGILDAKGYYDGYETCQQEMEKQISIHISSLDKVKNEKQIVLDQLKPKARKAKNATYRFVCLTLVCSLGLTSLLLGLGLTYLEKINDEYD